MNNTFQLTQQKLQKTVQTEVREVLTSKENAKHLQLEEIEI